MLLRTNTASALVAAGAVVALGAGCARPPVVEATPPKSAIVRAPVDFTGSWEIDYGRSDEVHQALKEAFRRLNRSAPRQGGTGSNRQLSVGTSYRGFESMAALARLAEEITQGQVLEIAQSNGSVAVSRENDFTLECEFADGGAQRVDTDFGTEICGWDGQQMVFHLALPDGTSVHHRVTLAPDGQSLHVSTTLDSATAPTPFTLSRFYTRFEPLADEYYCEETFSRKRVCSTRSPGG